MKSTKYRPVTAAELRSRAEAALQARAAAAPETQTALTPDATRALLHELHVQQIELEMQNEELRRAQGELEASKASYFDLYDLAPIGYCMVDEKGLILQVNLTLATLLGVARQAMVRKPFACFILQEDTGIFYLLVKQILAAHPTGADPAAPSCLCELRLKRGDGTPFWVGLVTTAATGESGETVLRVVVTDISARKLAEALMANAEGSRLAVWQSSLDAIITMDELGNITDFNPAAEKMFGYPAADVVGQSLADKIIPPALREGHRRGLAHLLATGEGPVMGLRIEVLAMRSGGTEFPVELTIVSVEGADRPVFIGTIRDITERKLAESKLLLADLVLKNVSKGVIISGLDQLIVSANAAFTTITGYSEQEIVGRNCNFLQGPGTDPVTVAAIRRALTDGNDFSGEILNFRKDGTPFWNELTITPVRDPQGVLTHFIGITRDITARRQAADALAASESRVRLLIRAGKVGLWDWDLVTGALYFSPEWKAHIGYADHELPARFEEWESRLHPEDRAATLAAVAEFQAGSRQNYDVEFRLRHRDGLWRWILTQAEITRDASGRAVRMTGSLIDITTRKRAEERFRQMTEQQIGILNALPAHIALLDPDGMILSVNEAWRRFASANVLQGTDFGVGQNYLDVCERAHGDCSDDARNASLGIRRVLHGELVDFAIEYPCYSPEENLWYRMMVTPLSENQRMGAVVMHINVTERKQAEAALRATEQRFADLVNSTDGIVWEADATTFVFTSVSMNAQRLLGYPAADWLQPGFWAAHIHPADRDHAVQYCAACASRTEDHDFEYRFTAADGRVVWLRDIVRVVSENNQPRWLRGLMVDITERKRAEESHARLASAVEQAGESIVISDSSGSIVYANPAFEKTTGYAFADILGKNLRVLKSGEHGPEYFREMWATLQRGEVWKGHCTSKRKDGTLVEEDATISPVRDASGKVVNYVSVRRDVTREMQLEEQFRQSQKMEAFGLLAGGIAHDFNNLMGVVIGYSEIWLKKLPPDAPVRTPLNSIKKAGLRAADLTKQLLTFSRKSILESKVLNINDVVRETQNILVRLIGEDIHVETILDSALPLIRVDPGQIGQVLINLAVNARDAMPQGGKLMIKTVAMTLDEEFAQLHPEVKPGRHVMISVGDTGSGMPPEIMARIFEPFFTTKDVGKGTGLGLAVVHGAVVQSGGSVTVESKVGEGTTFKLYFPIVPEAEPTAEKEEDTTWQGGNETVLVVEDEGSLRDFVSEALEMWGYTVLLTSAGPEALELADGYQGKIDLLLTDVVMPGMSGRDLADRLKQKLPELKILFMSGYTDDSMIRHGIDQAKVAFLQKPFAPIALLKKARELLGDGNRS